jgi:hypothetical protein
VEGAADRLKPSPARPEPRPRTSINLIPSDLTQPRLKVVDVGPNSLWELLALILPVVAIVAMDYPINACENVMYIHLMERKGRGVALVLYFSVAFLISFPLLCTASRFHPVPWSVYTVLYF